MLSTACWHVAAGRQLPLIIVLSCCLVLRKLPGKTVNWHRAPANENELRLEREQGLRARRQRWRQGFTPELVLLPHCATGIRVWASGKGERTCTVSTCLLLLCWHQVGLGQQTTDTAPEEEAEKRKIRVMRVDRVRQDSQPLDSFSGGTFRPYDHFLLAYHQQQN